MNIPPSDANIPVLTQIIEPPVARPAAQSAVETVDRSMHPAGLAAAASPESAFAEWSQIERVLNERVLRQLQGQIDFIIEHRVKDGLASALHKVADDLTDEVRRSLRKTLEDVIARAVAQEISKLQSKK